MRRTDKEIADRKELEEIINRAVICRLALWDGEWPYLVPLCFGYQDGILYFHSAPSGKKISILRKNNKVSFACDVDTQIVEKDRPCSWSMKYLSLIGYGEASFIENREDKRRALAVIMEHYGKTGADFSAAEIDKVAIFCVRIISMTGKKSVCSGHQEDYQIRLGETERI